MIAQSTLADIIRQKVSLGPENSRGFHQLKCPVCGDYQERGGFKFDAATTGYACWNCSARFKYEEGSGRLSRNAREILHAFGIEKEDLVALKSALFSGAAPEADEAAVTLESLKKVKLHTPEVALPGRSFPIGVNGHEELQLELAEYLLSRKIDPAAVHAHFSLDPRFLRRVIIPFYRDGKIIYWQARHIDDGVKPRYLNSDNAKDAVIYGYDELYSLSRKPLFVTEGVFDAISIGGICLLGAKLNESKIEVLKRTRRRVIFVIDRDKPGGELGNQVIENGWELSFVDKRVKDINASVVRFGLPYTAYCLLKNATTTVDRSTSKIVLDLGVLEGKLRRAR